MKTFIHLKTKKNILSIGLICFLFTYFNTLNAQSQIWEATEFPSDHNIIRPIDRERLLVYNFTTEYPSIGTFYSVPHNLFYKHIYLNRLFNFNDFEIVDNKYAYFCGEMTYGDSSGTTGLVTYINVENFDGSTTSLDVKILPFTWTEGRHFIRNFTKIEAFNVQDGTHLIMTGTATDWDNNIVSFIMDVYGPSIENSSGTPWTYRVMFGDDFDEVFNDITVTKNYIVSVSKQSLSGDLFLRLYDKPTTIYSDIFTTTTYKTVKYSCFLKPYSNIVIRNNEQDYYTLAYYANHYDNWGLTVHSYNAWNVYAEGFMKLSNKQNNDIVIRDIWYNKYNRTTDILCDKMEGSIGFWNPGFYKYSSLAHIYNSGSAFNTDLHTFDPTYSFFSNCIIPSNGVLPHMSLAIGKKNGIMEFYFGDLETIGNCTKKFRLTADELKPIGYVSEVPQTIEVGTVPISDLHIETTYTPMENICE